MEEVDIIKMPVKDTELMLVSSPDPTSKGLVAHNRNL